MPFTAPVVVDLAVMLSTTHVAGAAQLLLSSLMWMVWAAGGLQLPSWTVSPTRRRGGLENAGEDGTRSAPLHRALGQDQRARRNETLL